MNTFMIILIALAMLGVVASLLVGVFAMVRGGDFNKKYGNKLMRARVGLQATAIALLLISLWMGGKL